MSDSTAIEWADATFNPWIGCEKVSPGCAHCYAETLVNGRMGRPGTWGAEGARQRTSDALWRKPLRWEKLAREGRMPDRSENEDGHRPRVFCASLADVFEPRPELEPWRRELFSLIEATPSLDWLVLTKRPEIMRDWLVSFDHGRYACEDMPTNLWIGTSIENARHTWRADVLREIPADVRFISAEPLLGSLFEDPGHEWGRTSVGAGTPWRSDRRLLPNLRAPLDLTGIDWVIVGGESGPGARPMHPDWAREVRDACLAVCGDCLIVDDYPLEGATHPACGRPAVFFKQWGAWAPRSDGTYPGDVCLSHDGQRYVADENYVCAWNESDGEWLRKVGKKRSGRELDGRTWDEFPAVFSREEEARSTSR